MLILVVCPIVCSVLVCVCHFSVFFFSLWAATEQRTHRSVLLVLVLLEWRVSKWPRYRRAATGLVAFILNFAFLVSLFLIIVTATYVTSVARIHFK